MRATPEQRTVAGKCREILKLQDALFTFVRVEGIEPTNNPAEHALRHAVIWRKTSFGTDSEAGSRFVVGLVRRLLRAFRRRDLRVARLRLLGVLRRRHLFQRS